MKKILLLVFIVVAPSVFLGGCVHNTSPNVYSAGEFGVANKVKKGVVIAKRMIKIETPSDFGGIAGAAGGAAAGSMIGGKTAVNVVGGVGGAVVGGIVGHELDKAVNRRTGYEYIIKLVDGQTISIAQEKSVQLAVGQHVLIIYGAMTRVVPDDTAN